MPTDLSLFAKDIKPESTILFFGAGSSLPSHAPSVNDIIAHLSKAFSQPSKGYTLAELAGLIEHKTKNRHRMIAEVRTLFANLKPTGGLLNTPLYDWKNLYTTNYDELIESAYSLSGRNLLVYASNFDFTVHGRPTDAKLFKLHGTISQDTSNGHYARLIITTTDYDYLDEYRQKLFDNFKADLSDSNLIIIGHSLADEDIKDTVKRACELDAQALSGGRITLLMYEADVDRAILHEAKGIRVVFGGIDTFFSELAKSRPYHPTPTSTSADPLDKYPSLRPSTIDISHELDHASADVSRMFNGWPATYADIATGLTFDRTMAEQVNEFLHLPERVCAVILGASGVGKSTAARQAMLRLYGEGFCWEHRGDHTLLSKEWRAVARYLVTLGKQGALFIDDAHEHLHEVNELIDSLVSDKLTSLRVLAASSRNNWRPRAKTPSLFRVGKEFVLSQLDLAEIDRLLALVNTKDVISRLVEGSFSGFSRHEQMRRLIERAEADMFVCMKNIFASETFDHIVLREFAELNDTNQNIYRVVAALESAGVHVHRQLVVRLLGIPATYISAILEGLTDIVTEYTVSEKDHIYGWRGRHPVINQIITNYKFSDAEKTVDLFDKVIDNINPTYDIEIRSIRELCNVEYGIARIADKKIQNRLLRKMISTAPGERVPRHRLIRNLIEMGDFDPAETEIRVFDKDFGKDGPVARYKINLMVARAVRTPGIMQEDRVVMLERAVEEANVAIKQYPYTPQVFAAYGQVGWELFRLTGKATTFDDAMAQLKEAESRIGDPQITNMIRNFERRMSGQVNNDAA